MKMVASDCDFDKLKSLFYSGIHITMLISLFVCQPKWPSKNLFSSLLFRLTRRKKKSNPKKKQNCGKICGR